LFLKCGAGPSIEGRETIRETGFFQDQSDGNPSSNPRMSAEQTRLARMARFPCNSRQVAASRGVDEKEGNVMRLSVLQGMIGAVLLLASSAAMAQNVNDTVTPKEPIDLKIKDRVIATVKPKEVLTVEKVQDDWLWVVTSKNEHGWLMKGDVEPAKAPPPAPPSKASPSAPAEPGAEPPVDERLYLIGAMGATQVYLSYAYIGAIGDGYVNKSYDAAKVQELMTEVSGMSQHLLQQLEKVNEGDLTNEDRAAITQMIDINRLLKKEADALVTFSQKPTATNAESFEGVRRDVWPKIAKLLGIPTEENKEASPAPK
jgi:hypothetical protein